MGYSIPPRSQAEPTPPVDHPQNRASPENKPARSQPPPYAAAAALDPPTTIHRAPLAIPGGRSADSPPRHSALAPNSPTPSTLPPNYPLFAARPSCRPRSRRTHHTRGTPRCERPRYARLGKTWWLWKSWVPARTHPTDGTRLCVRPSTLFSLTTRSSRRAQRARPEAGGPTTRAALHYASVPATLGSEKPGGYGKAGCRLGRTHGRHSAMRASLHPFLPNYPLLAARPTCPARSGRTHHTRGTPLCERPRYARLGKTRWLWKSWVPARTHPTDGTRLCVRPSTLFSLTTRSSRHAQRARPEAGGPTTRAALHYASVPATLGSEKPGGYGKAGCRLGRTHGRHSAMRASLHPFLPNYPLLAARPTCPARSWRTHHTRGTPRCERPRYARLGKTRWLWKSWVPARTHPTDGTRLCVRPSTLFSLTTRSSRHAQRARPEAGGPTTRAALHDASVRATLGSGKPGGYGGAGCRLGRTPRTALGYACVPPPFSPKLPALRGGGAACRLGRTHGRTPCLDGDATWTRRRTRSAPGNSASIRARPPHLSP